MSMMTYFIRLILLMFLAIPGIVNGQSFSQKGSLYVNVTIPTNERNKAFNRTMEGLFNGGIGYQYNVYKGLTVGGGVNYSFFVLNRLEFNSTAGKGGMHIPAGHLKIGYEKFTTDRVSLYGGVNLGYSNIMVVSDSCKEKLNGPFQKGAFFIAPQIEINVLTEIGSPSAFNMILGYSWYLQEYNADYLCREFFPGYTADFSKGYIRFLNFGFGYKYYFGKN